MTVPLLGGPFNDRLVHVRFQMLLFVNENSFKRNVRLSSIRSRSFIMDG